jgi:hypothetical protein
MKTVRFAISFAILTPFVCNAQKAHRVSGGETMPTLSSTIKAYRVKEVQSDNTQQYSHNKAFSLNEETEEDNHKSEVFITVGAGAPCAPFASYIFNDVAQGAKIGTATHANYTIWFIKYIGLGIDLNHGYFGYDFSKIPSYTPQKGQTVTKTSKTGWNLIAFGISLRTKFPVYQNNVFFTGRVFMQYGMLNSPVSKVKYKTENDSKGEVVIFPQFVSNKFMLGSGIGVRVRVKKRLYALANFDYSYAISNNAKNKLSPDGRTQLLSNYSAFSVEAGIAYAF